MSNSDQVATAIRHLGRKLAELALPEETDQVLLLVAQQQKLLETYARSTPLNDTNYRLIRDVSVENSRLIERVKQAHADAAAELDALARARTAVSAYAGGVAQRMTG